MRRIFSARVPLGFFLATVVLLLLGSVLFGWVVQHRARGEAKAGALGELALVIAKSPRKVLDTLQALRATVTGYQSSMIADDYSPAGDVKFVPVPGLDSYGIFGPRQFAAEGLRRGWRVMVGLFNTGSGFVFGAILLDATMKAVHFWPLNEDGVEDPGKQGDLFKTPHAFEVLPDGSVLHVFDNGVSIRRIGVCGEEIWTALGKYHHSITLEPSMESLWTLRRNREYPLHPTRDELVQLSVADGTELQKISFDDIYAANPDLDILAIHSRPFALDPFHDNDVDPLPGALAGRFRGFEEGDLLISFRNINLIFVLDPESKKIKWWRFGASSSQHDPDWNPRGTFTVFDNNMRGDQSRIVEIDPVTFETRTLVDGAAFDFFSPERGKHQVLPGGSVLVTSTEQGRAFEVDPRGRLVFEFVNYRDEDMSSAFVLPNAMWLPEDFFEFPEFPKCSGERPGPVHTN